MWVDEDVLNLLGKKRNLRFQTILYWYEGWCTTCFSIWAANLSLPKVRELAKMDQVRQLRTLASLTKQKSRIFGASLALASSYFYLMRTGVNYYEQPVLNHMAWLGFHVTAGVSLASLTFLLAKGRGGTL